MTSAIGSWPQCETFSRRSAEAHGTSLSGCGPRVAGMHHQLKFANEVSIVEGPLLGPIRATSRVPEQVGDAKENDRGDIPMPAKETSARAAPGVKRHPDVIFEQTKGYLSRVHVESPRSTLSDVRNVRFAVGDQ